MGDLVEDATSSVVVIVGAGAGVLWEFPEAVVWAGDDDVGAWDGVEEGRTIGAVIVLVCAVDLWGGGLNASNTGVDAADFALGRSGDEPGGKVVGG